MIEILIASIVNKAIHQGDDKRLSFILERLIGKVSDELNVNSYMSKLQELSESQVIDLGRDAIKFLGDKK